MKKIKTCEYCQEHFQKLVQGKLPVQDLNLIAKMLPTMEKGRILIIGCEECAARHYKLLTKFKKQAKLYRQTVKTKK